MASNEVEVLDPTATVENLPETESGSTLNRRHFMAALGVVGAAAAGIGLLSSSPDAQAQQTAQNGYQQTDILNFLLNIKYLKATFYAWMTTGADLPDALVVGSQVISAIPGETVKSGLYTYPAAGTNKLAVSGALTQKVLDMMYEMYSDEVQQLYDLRALLGTLAINRPALNIQGNMQSTGQIFNVTTTTTFSITQNLALGISRLLEDLSVTAFAYATQYLSGANLAYATQILASDGFHSGAVRLACIQGSVPYIPTQYSVNTYSGTSTTVTNFAASVTSGSNLVYGVANTSVTTNTFPSVGQIVTGTGIPANTVVTAYTAPNGTVSVTSPAIIVAQASTIPLISTAAATFGQPANIGPAPAGLGLAVGQPVTGTYIPAGSFITAVNTSTGVITLSTAAAGVVTAIAASASTTIAPTGIITAGSPTITGLSSVTGILPGQLITWQATASAGQTTLGTIPANTYVYSVNADNSVTMGTGMQGATGAATVNATASSIASFSGLTTTGSNLITSLSSPNAATQLIVGQPLLTSPGFASGTTILGVGTNSVLVSTNATATVTTPVTFTTPTPNTFTLHATETITIGTGSITLSNPATITTCPVSVTVITADPADVEPVDLGAVALAGPAAIAGASPAVYQGFFNTAGAGNGSGGTPAGFAFARTFSQVLQVLFNTMTTQTTQATSGGFFPSGVGGTITGV